jgi:hypothetical protein
LVDFELDVHARQDGHRNGRHARNKREEDRDNSARICISLMSKHRFFLSLFPGATSPVPGSTACRGRNRTRV